MISPFCPSYKSSAVHVLVLLLCLDYVNNSKVKVAAHLYFSNALNLVNIGAVHKKTQKHGLGNVRQGTVNIIKR